MTMIMCILWCTSQQLLTPAFMACWIYKCSHPPTLLRFILQLHRCKFQPKEFKDCAANRLCWCAIFYKNSASFEAAWQWKINIQREQHHCVTSTLVATNQLPVFHLCQTLHIQIWFVVPHPATTDKSQDKLFFRVEGQS